MAVYIVTFMMISFNVLIIDFLNIKNEKVLLVSTFIILYFLLAFRADTVGADTLNYADIFYRAQLTPFRNLRLGGIEPGYILLNKLLGFLNSSQYFIAIVSFLTLLLFLRFIYKESKSVWLSIFLFITMGFYADMFNILRQMIAMGIITISYKYLKENNLIKFLITVAIASTFHITALVFIPIFFFKKNKLDIKNFSIYIVVAAILYFFSVEIINVLLRLFSNIQYEIIPDGGEKLLILLISVLIFGLIFKKSVIMQNKHNTILYNIMIFSVLLQIMSLNFSLFTRITSYYRMFIIIFIPEILFSIKNKKTKYLFLYLVLVMAIIYYIFILHTDSNSIVPYSFYF